MKMDRKKAIIIAIILLTSTTLAVGAINGGWFNFIYEPPTIFPSIDVSEIFSISEYIEYLDASVTITGPGMKDQPHDVLVEIWHTRPDTITEGYWEVSDEYILTLEPHLGGNPVETIRTGNFNYLKAQPEIYTDPFIWTPVAPTADYNIRLSMSGLTWSLYYDISVSAGSGGTISPEGNVISPEGTVKVLSGTPQGFNIIPDAGYEITDVLVDGSSVGAVVGYIFGPVDGSHTIEASFAQITYTINASAGTGGTIEPAGPVTVLQGDTPSFTINPDSGYVIDDVLVDSVSVGAVISYDFLAVYADHTISATFTVELTSVEMGATEFNSFIPTADPWGGIIDSGETLFNGLASNSYQPGETVSLTWNAEVWFDPADPDPVRNVIQIFYRIEVERVGGGDRTTVVGSTTTNTGNWGDGAFIPISETFIAPAYGEWTTILTIEDCLRTA